MYSTGGAAVCHDHESRPPAPPRIGEVAERAAVTLTSADGTKFSAAWADPAKSVGVGVVVLPDVRGLHPYYVALVERFAEAGMPAVAIDWFGRTADLAGAATGSDTREDDFDWQSHIPLTTPAAIDADITSGIEYLRSQTSADLPVITVGFCFGGSHSWRQSGGELDLAGCVGFYGRPELVGDAAYQARRPTLMLVAGADHAASVPEQQRLAAIMRAAGAEVDMQIYEEAPHSFFDRTFYQWSDACSDAWRRVLDLADSLAGR